MPSLRQRGDRWMILFRDDSNRQRSGGSFTSKAEAAKAMRKLHDGQEKPKPKTYSSKALGTVAWEWFKGHQMEEATSYVYDSVLRNWILPYLGDKPLSKITKADIRAWVKWMQGKGAGAPTIHKAHICLSAMFSTAVEDEEVKTNPCNGAKLPPMVRGLKHVITKEEFDVLLLQMPEKYRPLLQVAIGTGARQGECIALTPDDVDGQWLSITKTISYKKVKHHPKNAEHRRIKITPELAKVMETYPDYSKLSLGSFRLNHWHPACRRAGIKDFNFHDLRATHASWLAANGCDVVTIQERLGHHDLKTTMLYLHTLPNSQDAALSALERAMAA